MSEPNLARPQAEEIRQQLAGKHVCPFCGVIRSEPNQPCPRCTMEDNNGTRSATRQRIGPWFVLQARNPSAPGMKFSTLLSIVKKGHVTPRSIVRGPTTHQLWTFASKVRGLSREFGICYHCGESMEPGVASCGHCDRPQDPPAEPDALLEAGASTAPELTLTAASTQETGMDGGGASLDLQLDDVPYRPSVPRPVRPAKPVTAQVPVVSNSVGNVPSAKAQEESILTARELAAAFQLDFKPTPGNAQSKEPQLAPVVSQTPKPVRKGSFLKTLMVFLLIALIAVAIVLTLRQDLRERTFAWANDQWTRFKASLEEPSTNPPVKNPVPQVQNPVSPVSPPKQPVVSNPPQVPVKPVQTQKPPEVVHVEPKIDTPKPPEVKPPVPPVELPLTPPPVDIDAAIALARTLRTKALDAEGNNWPLAVSLYEQILKLPPEAWPGDVQRRLEMARKNVK